MKIIEKDIGEVFPYDNNPRKNEKAVGPVAESLKKFGWQQPIVIDRNNVIIAGHTRWEAAQRLGMKKVPCKYADELTPEEVQAYRLADNKTAELASWEFDDLAEELAQIKDIDMEAFGFDDGAAEEAKYEDQEEEMSQDDTTPESEIVIAAVSLFGEENELIAVGKLSPERSKALLEKKDDVSPRDILAKVEEALDEI